MASKTSLNSYDMDGFFGRLGAMTAAATDAYAETQISLPSVPVVPGQNNVFVPVLKRCELQWIGSLAGVSADAQLLAELYNYDAAFTSGASSMGIADIMTVWSWRQGLSLTTSGQVLLQNQAIWEPPGDGLILLSPQLTVLQSNTATGVSLALAARVWYEFVSMSQEAYLIAIHS